ncbi:hypothetical protein ACOSQ3_017642 [Xanthoceras sorbifolium]
MSRFSIVFFIIGMIKLAKVMLELVPKSSESTSMTALSMYDGGPTWEVELGRRDSRTANLVGTSAIPLTNDGLDLIQQKFTDQGLDSIDLVVLSGAHTFGQAQ